MFDPSQPARRATTANPNNSFHVQVDFSITWLDESGFSTVPSGPSPAGPVCFADRPILPGPAVPPGPRRESTICQLPQSPRSRLPRAGQTRFRGSSCRRSSEGTADTEAAICCHPLQTLAHTLAPTCTFKKDWPWRRPLHSSGNRRATAARPTCCRRIAEIPSWDPTKVIDIAQLDASLSQSGSESAAMSSTTR